MTQNLVEFTEKSDKHYNRTCDLFFKAKETP